MWRAVSLGVALVGVLAGCGGDHPLPYGEVKGVVGITSTKPFAPFPFARVTAVRASGSRAATFRADGDGRFEKRLPAGRYTLRVMKPGWQSVRATVVVRSGRVARVRLVALAP